MHRALSRGMDTATTQSEERVACHDSIPACSPAQSLQAVVSLAATKARYPLVLLGRSSLDAGARAGACTGLDNLTMQLDNNLTGLTGSQGSSRPDRLDNP